MSDTLAMIGMRRLLVVDPEPARRAAIRQGIGPAAEHWDFELGVDAEDARRQLHGSPLDAIFLDIELGPELDALLVAAAELQPRATRVVVGSIVTTDQQMAGIAGHAHRFVPRPLDLPTILDDLGRAAHRREVLANPALEELVIKADNLPTRPGTWLALTVALADPSMGAADMGAIVEGSPGVATKALQLANSAWFGLPRRVHDVREAVVLLGGEAVRALVLSAEVSESLGAGVPAPALARFERHAMAVARGTNRIAPPRHRRQALAAGLLHDVGELLIWRSQPDVATAAAAAPTTAARLHFERDALGATHAEIGAALLSVWGLPDELVDVAADHHRPVVGLTGGLDLTGCVHVADVLANLDLQGQGDAAEISPDIAPDGLDVHYLDAAGVAGQFESWLSEMS